jgi:hypothetical protein
VRLFGGGGGTGPATEGDDGAGGAGGGGSGGAIAAATGVMLDAGVNDDPNGNGSLTISWEPGVGCISPIETVIRFTG